MTRLRPSLRPARRWLSWLWLAACGLFPLHAPGAEQPQQTALAAPPRPPAAAGQTEAEPDLLTPLDAPRNYLSEQLQSYAKGIDRYFAGDRNFQETNQSVLQLDITRTSGALGDGKVAPYFRAKLDLPNTEKRLHLLLQTDPDKNVSGVTPQGQAAQATPTTSPSSLGAAVRYEKGIEEVIARYVSADAGIRLSGLSLRPFARVRGSFSKPFGEWRAGATETLFWFNTIGGGETTQLDLEHLLSDPLLFRSSSSATWLNQKGSFDFRQDFSLYHTVDDRNALLYQASVVGVSSPVSRVTDEVLLVQYRRRVHQKWMYLEVIPQIHFPEVRSYHLSTLLLVKLEMSLDESR